MDTRLLVTSGLTPGEVMVALTAAVVLFRRLETPLRELFATGFEFVDSLFRGLDTRPLSVFTGLLWTLFLFFLGLYL